MQTWRLLFPATMTALTNGFDLNQVEQSMSAAVISFLKRTSSLEMIAVINLPEKFDQFCG